MQIQVQEFQYLLPYEHGSSILMSTADSHPPDAEDHLHLPHCASAHLPLTHYPLVLWLPCLADDTAETYDNRRMSPI